jgi:hypothetical protein
VKRVEKQFKDGTYYGDLQEGKKHGKGKMIYLSGKIYEGEWKNGKKDGYGKMTYANGDVFEGEWKNNKRNGEGALTSKSGIEEKGNWINDDVQESSKKLNASALETLNKEYMALTGTIKGYMPEIAVIKSFIGYFTIADDYEMKKNIRLYILCAIKNGNSNSNPEYVNSVFKECETDGELFSQLIDILFQETEAAREIFYSYEDILNDSHFTQISTGKILESMQNSKNKIEDNKIIISNFNSEKDSNIKNNAKLSAYINNTKRQCDGILLGSIDLNKVSKEEIFNIQFSGEYNSKGYKIIKAAKEIFLFGVIDVYTIKKNTAYLGNDETDFKTVLRRLLQKEIKNENFYKIAYAFEADNKCQFDSMINYIKLAGRQEIYNFLVWVFENKVFFNLGASSQQNGNVDTKFIEAVKKYFLNEDKEAIKNRELRKRFKKYPKLDKVMNELEYETSSETYKKLKKLPKSMMKSASSVKKIPKSLGEIPKALMKGVKILIKPVNANEVGWMILLSLAFFVIYRTDAAQDLLLIDYVKPTLDLIFLGVGAGLLLNNFLAPLYVAVINWQVIFGNSANIFTNRYAQEYIFGKILSNFIAGILINLVGALCKKNITKYAFTVLIMIFSLYIGGLCSNPNYIFNLEFARAFNMLFNMFSSVFVVSLLSSCLVIFIIKKIKKDY